jgi:hypothetical protein
LPTPAKDFSAGEQGSLAPLGIGLALLSLTTVLAILASGSLYLTERRLTGVAESTALSVLADARGNLNQPLNAFAQSYLAKHRLSGLHEVALVDAVSNDGLTVKVRVCSTWLPIFRNYIFSETGKVCSEALARRGR